MTPEAPTVYIDRGLIHKVARFLSMGLLTCIGAIALPLGGRPVYSAEKIHFAVGPLDFTLSVASLETFAETGEITGDFRRYARFFDPVTLEQFRELLQDDFEASHVAVAQVTYSPMGEDFLEKLGRVVQTGAGNNGFYAIRAALIKAAQDPKGMTLLGILRHFPTNGIRLNTREFRDLMGLLTAYFEYRDSTVDAIATQAEQEAAVYAGVDFSQLPDLRQPGGVPFSQQTLTIVNPDVARGSRSPDGLRRFQADLYAPQGLAQPAPVIVISHGLGANKGEFMVRAQHLASHGFAVVVPEHIGSDATLREERFAGTYYGTLNPYEVIDRPQDITVTLDELERLTTQDPTLARQLDLDRVGVIGHSFGGYTALALVGAPLNLPRVRQVCAQERYNLDFSLVLQCQAVALPVQEYGLADSRIDVAIALNPVSSPLLGPESIAQIRVPVMILTGSHDVLTPAISQQIHPFIWLTTPHKYLALLKEGSHTSTFANINPAEADRLTPLDQMLAGPDPDLGSAYEAALTVAFLRVHLQDRQDKSAYLSAAYANYLSQPPMELALIQTLTSEQLETAYGDPSRPQFFQNRCRIMEGRRPLQQRLNLSLISIPVRLDG